MPTLADHQSNKYVKSIIIGNSKAGKTGGLVSLVEAGYKLCILDMDNLLDSLKYQILNRCPDKIGNVVFQTFRDKRKATPTGPEIDGLPMAYINAVKSMDKWPDLGKPADLGPDWIFVLDSLTRLCDSAYDWAEALAMAQGKYDGRAVFYTAQKAVEDNLANFSSDNFKTNVLIICHIKFLEQPDGSVKGFPQGIGKALSPIVPTYFPSVILITTKGGKRVIRTADDPIVDLANPAPFTMAKEYPLETGLADFFAVLRDPPQASKIRRIK